MSFHSNEQDIIHTLEHTHVTAEGETLQKLRVVRVTYDDFPKSPNYVSLQELHYGRLAHADNFAQIRQLSLELLHRR
jgi:hypothetical protein